MALSRNHIEAWNRHWAPGTLGPATPGDVFGAMASGLAIDFMNEFLTWFDAVTPDIVNSKLVAASGAASLAAPLSYGIYSKGLVLTAGSTNLGGVPNTAGILPYSALAPKRRGLLALILADIDAESMLTLTQTAGGTNMNWLSMNDYQNWECSYHVAALVNSDIAAANGAAELGVTFDGCDVDPANPMGTYFCHFRIGAGKIVLADENGDIATESIPTGDFHLSLRYDAAAHKIHGYLNGRHMGSSSCHANFVSAGIGTRVYHTAAYTALGAAPLGVYIDSITAHNLTVYG